MSGHEVDECRGSFSALEARLQDQRVGLVSPCYPGRFVLCGNEPAAMFRRAEESRETSVRIKARSSSLSIDSRARGRQRDPLGPPPARRRPIPS